MKLSVTPWDGQEPLSEGAVERRMQAEGLTFYAWSNGPGDVYAAHTHPYHKVIYVARGAIVFGLPQSDQHLYLHQGDRLTLPAGTVYEATVGTQGVLCYEAHVQE